ncbi:AraC family transcriptional regulator [Lutibacter agarilyticus]|uniref:AraC family transcriptional regulator n=1 Tax=Lutibacter agarilyticus TaxID=1109740 RepID=A0A238XGD6_9FLAO|nr:GyrI-like domain-containing protein [Lutibacter agarilyticus]SNR57752.1 AraC family transcriptional regulator [Lutibacter agarilyticus]
MQPRIEKLSEKKLVGKSLKMSLITNKTTELWKGFMPKVKMIQNKVGSDFISMQIYDKSLNFKDFNPQTEFTKYAMIETSKFENIPEEMETRILKGGLYAVFVHKGMAIDFPKTSQYIFNQWLPNSEYELDQREHFELLGAKYNPTDKNSEEEVWIPIKYRENIST